MTDRKQPSPTVDPELEDMFVDITGKTTITEQQEQETGKKVINDADPRPSQGEI